MLQPAPEIEAPAIGHPQFAMQALLKRIGIARAEVCPLARPAAAGRERFVSEALRPAPATDRLPQVGCLSLTACDRAI